MRQFKKRDLYGGGSGYSETNIAGEMIVDAIDTSLYRHVSAGVTSVMPDNDCLMVEHLWEDIINNKVHIGQRIKLRNALITEWIPRSPGLFHTREGNEMRIQAESFMVRPTNDISEELFDTFRRSLLPNSNESAYIKPKSKNDFVEYNPMGKQKMILGGLGSVRLTPKYLYDKDQLFIMGVSSSGFCHKGLPIIMKEDVYQGIIDGVKTHSGLHCSLVGKLAILPTDELPIRYPRRLAKYCLWVEEIEVHCAAAEEEVIVTVAINFSESDQEFDGKKWSFVTFPADRQEKHLADAVDWLTDYARRYSNGNDPIILSDFDEFKDHFDRVEFPLRELSAGNLDFGKINKYSRLFNLKIVNVMGDNFNNISGTVINRSTVTNSFNKISDSLGAESEQLLKQITTMVEQSGNQDAKDNLEAFHTELVKPEPKKSMLTTFWNGVTAALPALITNTDKVVEIIEKISKMAGH